MLWKTSYRLQKVTKILQLLPAWHGLHIGEAEERSCDSTAHNGSNFIAAILNINNLTLPPSLHVMCEIMNQIH